MRAHRARALLSASRSKPRTRASRNVSRNGYACSSAYTVVRGPMRMSCARLMGEHPLARGRTPQGRVRAGGRACRVAAAATTLSGRGRRWYPAAPALSPVTGPRHEHRHLQQRREVLRRPAAVHHRHLLRRRSRPRRAGRPQRHRQDHAAAPDLRRRARRLGDHRPRPGTQDLAPRADPGARARPPRARVPARGVRRGRRARGRAARDRGAPLRPRRAQPGAARHHEDLPAAPAALRGRGRLRVPRPPGRGRRGPGPPRGHARP